MWTALMLVTATLVGGAKVAQAPSRPASASDPQEAAREIMVAARYCTLVTVDQVWGPQARSMDPFAPEADLTVWMATNPKSRKVEQIRFDPRVVLHYLDPKSQDTVTIYGRARLITDAGEKKRRWKEEWKVFYPDRDTGYLLIAVTPERVELLSPVRGFSNDPVTWRPFTVQMPVRKDEPGSA